MSGSLRRRVPSTAALLGFEAVVRTGSVTAAAGELCLTQGAVSRQIAELEGFLGVRLFDRVRKRLVASPQALGFAAKVRPVLATLEQATLELRSMSPAGGTLSLLVAPTLANRWLMPRLAGFYALHPHRSLDLTLKAGLFPDLVAQGVHAALSHCAAPPTGLVGDFLFTLELVPVCAPALLHGARLRSDRELAAWLPGAPLLQQRTLPDCWSRLFDAIGLPAAQAAPGPRYDLLSIGQQAALAGVGVALLPLYVVQEDLARRRLVRLGRVRLPMPSGYWLLYAPADRDRAPLRDFRSWLLEAAQA